MRFRNYFKFQSGKVGQAILPADRLSSRSCRLSGNSARTGRGREPGAVAEFPDAEGPAARALKGGCGHERPSHGFIAAAGFIALIGAAALSAQMAPELKIAPQATVKVKRGAPATVTLKVSLPAGFHANSNKPTEPNLIPLTLKWTGGPLQDGVITYPKPLLETYTFTAGKPISVVEGAFDLVTKFNVPATAPAGPGAQTGTLRYQACNDRMCFPPKTVQVNVTVSVE